MQPIPDLNENPTVVVCGSIHLDTLVEIDSISAEGGTLIVDDGTNSLGDEGANQAVAIAYDGVRAVTAGAVGEDCAADVVVGELSTHGVDVHSIQTSWDLPTSSAFAATSRKGQPVIFVRRDADALTDPIDFVDEFVSVDVVLVQGELFPEATEVIASVASMYNARLVLNLNPVITVTPALTGHADPLIVNTRGTWKTIRRLDIAKGIRAIDYRAQLEAPLQYCPSVVILRGDNGCLFAQHSDGLDDGPTIYEHPTLKLPKEKIVDGTGSGDAFVGTLTTELAKGTSPYGAVPLATAAGAAAVQVVGVYSAFVHRDKLLEMIEAEDFPAIHVY